MKYISVILLVILYCKTPNKEMKEMQHMTNVVINYEGNIDKPLPTIIFCKDCKESFDFMSYKFKMEEDFFKSVDVLLSSSNYNAKKENNIVLSVIINEKRNKKLFLKRNEAKLLIEKVIKSSIDSKNNLLNSQLDRYYKVLNK